VKTLPSCFLISSPETPCDSYGDENNGLSKFSKKKFRYISGNTKYPNIM
jgi:hypothetical protein